MNKLQIHYFLTQPILIDQNEQSNCMFIERGLYDIELCIILTNCYFQDCIHRGFNFDEGFGGAISISLVKSLSITNVIFRRCGCTIRGGAIAIENGEYVKINHCDFYDCHIALETIYDKNNERIAGCLGAACSFQNIKELLIFDCKFIDNYINPNLTNKYSDNFKYTIIFIGCHKINLNTSYFSNNINVKTDVFFSLYSYSYYKDNSEISVKRSCFMTVVDNAIDIDSNEIKSAYFLMESNCFLQTNFIQPIDSNITFDAIDNFFGYNYCKFSQDFTPSFHFSQSQIFTKSLMFTSTSSFTDSYLFTASSDFLPTKIFSLSSKFSKSSIFSESLLLFFVKDNDSNPSNKKNIYIGVGVSAAVVVIIVAIIVIVLFLHKYKEEEDVVKGPDLNDSEYLGFKNDLNFGL